MRLRARAFTLLISEVRVYEDGVKSIKPEAKCDWARGGCSGDQFLRLGGKPFHRGASNRLRGCVSTQVSQPGGEIAKVRGGGRGPIERGRS